MKGAQFWKQALATGLPLAIVATLILAIGYVQDQQLLRQSANEPQLWMAESIAARLSAGAALQQFIPNMPVVLETDQAPYVVIYDEHGNPLEGNATLNGTLPRPPIGVFGGHKDNATTNDNRISWQPSRDIRQAIVVAPFDSGIQKGYVLVGRSLRETETRESTLLMHAIVSWLGTMILVLLISIVSVRFLQPKNN